MNRDITIGRYHATGSVLEKLDPRVKLTGLVVGAACAFLVSSWIPLLLYLLSVAYLVKLSRVSIKSLMKGIGPILFILILTDLFAVFFTKNGLEKAIFTTSRVVSIIILSNLLTTSTKPRKIAEGIEKAFASTPHAHDAATVIMIAFNFLPILSEETDRIMDAQKARGADFENGSLLERGKALLPVFVPLFISAFRKADELSEAMDLRLYGAAKATSLHPLEYSALDRKAYWLILLYTLVFILGRILC